MLVASNEGRLPALVPIRMGRMLASPFALFRGSAAIMAADLATTPTIGSMAQLCGDAHLANFGVYASPERRLVFDLNDFDETYRGPWEWDLKRLAASVVVASRENGYPEEVCRDIARSVGREYRQWIRTYASMRALQVWYAAIPIEHILERVEQARAAGETRVGLAFSMEEAQRKDHLAALGKLSIKAPGGGYLIRDRPPLIVRLPDDDPGRSALPYLYRGYIRSLRQDRRVLVEKHRLVDVALKVVGVGSVGTRCYVAMFVGPAGGPLILQVKEAGESVLAPYIRGRRHRHQGERVVTGQRIMQALSDSFLGWTRSPVTGTEYYVRQLHDMKYGFDIGGLATAGDAPVRGGLCLGAGSGPCPLGQSGRDRGLSRSRIGLRRRARVVRGGLRRPGRTRPRGPRGRRSRRPDRGRNRRLAGSTAPVARARPVCYRNRQVTNRASAASSDREDGAWPTTAAAARRRTRGC